MDVLPLVAGNIGTVVRDRATASAAAAGQGLALHRGFHSPTILGPFSAESPLENTARTVLRGIDQGFTTFETDVHRTRDGILVSHHDLQAQSHYGTNVGPLIADTDYADLGNDVDGLPLSTFRDWLRPIGDAGGTAIIERKNTEAAQPGVVEAMLDQAYEVLPPERVRFISFDMDSVRAAAQLRRPGTEVGALFGMPKPTFAAPVQTYVSGTEMARIAKDNRADFVSISATHAQLPGVVDELRAAGFPVDLWPMTQTKNGDLYGFVGDPRIRNITTDEGPAMRSRMDFVVGGGEGLPKVPGADA